MTAQKREENLQKTPISISVLKPTDIANRHIQSLLDLQDGSIPSLRVLPFSGRNFSLVLNIRGVGVLGDSNQPARDAGVGVYIDGVYLGRPQGLNGALYDLESIEVLKGPQGTLFGRNTEGGALNIVSKKPSGKFGLSVTAGAGNYGSYETEAHLDLPEWHNFSVKVDGLITSRDGTVRNTMPAQSDFNGYYRRGIRTQLKWQPTPDVTALYAYDNIYDSSTVGYEQRLTVGTAFVPTAALQPNRTDQVAFGIPLQPSIGKQNGHMLTVTWQAKPHLTIKSISSYRELSQSQYDGGGMAGGNYVTTAAPNGLSQHDNVSDRYSLANFQQYQYSQELQAIGDIGRVKFVVGGLAYHEHVRDQAQAFNTGYFNSAGQWIVELPGTNNLMNTNGQTGVTNVVDPLNPYVGVDRASIAKTTSYGIFGQATWNPALLEDRLHLTGGLRWTDDKKSGTLLLTNNFAPVNSNGTFAPISFKAEWKRVDPMVNLAVDLARDIQAYGKWSTGYKSGGANSRSLNYRAFDPESISIFEVGLKSEFFDHHARFNIAGYTGIYKNQQVDFSVPYFCYSGSGAVIACPGAAVTTRTTTNTYNTPQNGRVSGIETELTLAPIRGLTVGGSYTYAYVRVGAAVDPFCEPLATGGCAVDPTPRPQQPVNTPKHSASGQIDYETPFYGMTLRGHFDGAWDSGYYGSSTPNAVGVLNPRSQPGAVFNTRISLGDIELAGSGAKMTLSFWVRNLFNEQHVVNRTYSTGTGYYGYFNDPRTFGGQVNIRF
ncbi:TonB-dependent receptor plug domain-containing protein [Novosphingobium sp.]|uniref:TonB-dependent receptor n=1 Tax=Novosphingobium sp. TaxID=1874826 RepID=UPI0031E3A08B